jgi:hypothetical protein
LATTATTTNPAGNRPPSTPLAAVSISR